MRIRAERLFWFHRRFFRLLFFAESQCRHVNFRYIGIHRVFLLLLRFLFLFSFVFFFFLMQYCIDRHGVELPV